MSCGKLSAFEHFPDTDGQVEQSEDIGDAGAGFTDPLGDLILRQLKLIGQFAVAFGFFHQVKVIALQIFDERNFKRFLIADIKQDNRHFRQVGRLGGAQAALPGDQFKMFFFLPDEQRLKNPVFLDRGDQLVERFVAEDAARLHRVGFDAADRDLRDTGTIRSRGVHHGCRYLFFLNERIKPAT